MSKVPLRKRCLDNMSGLVREISTGMATEAGAGPSRFLELSSPPEKHFCSNFPLGNSSFIQMSLTPVVSLESPRFPNNVLQHMNKLRLDNKYCDLVLIASSGSVSELMEEIVEEPAKVEFAVHKVVMVAASDYFEAMLRTNMVEAQENRVELKGITSVGLKKIIEFIYTGVLEISFDLVQDVLGAASFLQVSEAMDLCSRFLESKISLDTIVSILNLGEFYNMERLILKARMFCLEHFDALADSDDFLRLDEKQIHFLLLENRLKVRDEFRLFQCLCRWLDSDITARQQHIAKLVSSIRLPLLTGEQLVEEVSAVEFMRCDAACRELLTEAKDYHIVVSKQPMLQSARTQVRSDHLSLVMVHAENLEAYNLRLKKHCFLKDCPISMYNPQVTVVNNFLYVCGGRYDCNEQSEIASARCFRYDPRFDVWHELTPMNEARKDFVLLALDEDLYAIGGQDENMVMCTVEKYSIRRNEWEYCSSLRNSVYGHAGAALVDDNESWLFTSGGTRHDGFSDSLKRFNPQLNQWQDCPPMHCRRANHIMECVRGHLFVLGGNVEDNYSFPVPVEPVERYDPVTEQWTLMKTRITIREAGSCVACAGDAGEIFIAGGLDADHYFSHTIQVYEPESDYVRLLQRFPTRIYGKACAVLVLPQNFSL